MHRLPRRALCAAALLSAALTAACEDLPSGPQVWTREAAGRTWVAVAEPAGMASARGWMTWAAPAVQDSLRTLLAASARERRAGRLEVGLALEERAAELAVSSLVRTPDPVSTLAALAAVESWMERASGPVSTGRFPELGREAAAVRGLTDAARASLAAGDTAAACAHLTRASGMARRWTPIAVAARAVAEAEASIAADPDPSPDLVRARRLLRGAREGVAAGDHARGLQRAMYALQLIEHARGR